MCPRYSVRFCIKKHLLSRGIVPACRKGVSIWAICSTCSSTVFVNMIKSSTYTMHKFHLHVDILVSVTRWNVAGALHKPKGIWKNWNNPWWVTNPFLCTYFPSVLIFQYPCFSPMWKIQVRFRGGSMHFSILGIGYESRMVISFTLR